MDVLDSWIRTVSQEYSRDIELAHTDSMVQSGLASFTPDVAIDARLQEQADGVGIAPRYRGEKLCVAKDADGPDCRSFREAGEFDNLPYRIQYIIRSDVFAHTPLISMSLQG